MNIETVRHYERLRLMRAPARSGGGRRMYDGMLVRHLNFIRRSRELGFSLADIRKLLRLADDQGVDCGTVRDLTVHHLADTPAREALASRREHA